VLVVLFLGLALITAGSTFVVRKPRQKGEAFSTQRKLYLGVTVLGALLVLTYGVFVLLLGRGN
jgi:hypothetical protein